MPRSGTADEQSRPLRVVQGATEPSSESMPARLSAEGDREEHRHHEGPVDEARIARARTRQVGAIGKRIKDLRRNHYTLGQLAETSGVSVGLLSRLENGIGNPSFAALNAIARALDVDVYTFFDASDRSAVVLRQGQRTLMRNMTTRVSCELLSTTLPAAQRTGLVATLIELPRNQSEPPWVDSTTESRDQLELVLHGTVAIEVENEKYELEEGDSIMFDASRRHRRFNRNRKEPALVFCVSREIDWL